MGTAKMQGFGTVSIGNMHALLGDVTPVPATRFGLVSGTPPELRAGFGFSKGIAVATAAATLTVLSGTPPTLAACPPLGRISALPGFAFDVAAPDVHVDQAAERILAEDGALVREMTTLLRSEARRQAIRSSGFRISRFDDPDEGDRQLVVTQVVDATAEVALAYWDDIGRVIQAWTRTLSDKEARILVERIAVNIDWNDADSAVRPG